MKTRSSSGRIKGAVNRLFGLSKPNVTRVNHKDQYYKNYYFPKNMCRGIEKIAKLERCSKRKAAIKAMEAGLSYVMFEKIQEQNQIDKLARERGEEPPRTRFRFMIRKLARQQDLDVTKLF